MYSATEAREDAADAVSQSLSVLRLALRLSVGKASRDSTLLKERGSGGRAGMVTGTPSPTTHTGWLSPPDTSQPTPSRQEGTSAAEETGGKAGGNPV